MAKDKVAKDKSKVPHSDEKDKHHIALGRPPIYRDEEIGQFKADIESYFAKCDIEGIIPNVEGLCSALRCITRVTMLKWEKERAEFSYLIRDAKQRCVGALVTAGINNKSNSTFTMFVLKCLHGYRDNTTVTINQASIEDIVNDLSDEEIFAILEKNNSDVE